MATKKAAAKRTIATNATLSRTFGYPQVIHRMIGPGAKNDHQDGPYPTPYGPGDWIRRHYGEAVRRLAPGDTDKALMLFEAHVDGEIKRARENGLDTLELGKITDILPDAKELALKQIEEAGMVGQALEDSYSDIRIMLPFPAYLARVMRDQFNCATVTPADVEDLAKHPDPYSLVEYALRSHGWRKRILYSLDPMAALRRYWPTMNKQWVKKGSEVGTGLFRLSA